MEGKNNEPLKLFIDLDDVSLYDEVFSQYFSFNKVVSPVKGKVCRIYLNLPITVIVTLPSVYDVYTPDDCTIIRQFDAIFYRLINLINNRSNGEVHSKKQDHLISGSSTISHYQHNEESYLKVIAWDGEHKLIENLQKSFNLLKFNKIYMLSNHSESEVKKRMHYLIKNIIQCDVIRFISEIGNEFPTSERPEVKIASLSVTRKFQQQSKLLQTHLKFFNDNEYVHYASLGSGNKVNYLEQQMMVYGSSQRSKLLVRRATYNINRIENNSPSDVTTDKYPKFFIIHFNEQNNNIIHDQYRFSIQSTTKVPFK